MPVRKRAKKIDAGALKENILQKRGDKKAKKKKGKGDKSTLATKTYMRKNIHE